MTRTMKISRTPMKFLHKEASKTSSVKKVRTKVVIISLGMLFKDILVMGLFHYITEFS